MTEHVTQDMLVEKWDGVLNSKTVPEITNQHAIKTTAQLLENTEQALLEAGEGTQSVTGGGIDNTDPTLIKLVRRMAPKLIAYDIAGVQAMRRPTGLIFALKSHYTNQQGAEALHQEANTAHSGDPAGAQVGTDPFDPNFATSEGMTTQEAEGDANWNEMAFSIEKTSVEAKSRQLKASYSLELAQDLKAIHGLDADTELSNILNGELISEVNRQVVRTVYQVAKVGGQFTTTPGTFDLATDADGRWSVEKFKGLIFAIQRDMNAIAIDTRRGLGNILICSPDVGTALSLAGQLDNAPALNSTIVVDPTGASFAGTMRNGTIKVYIDPYATGDFYVVGYKGANQYDAGLFYCPYVPLQQVRATNQDSFQPVMGFKTRYGMVANPFTTLSAGQNNYYRKVKVANLQ